MCVLEEEEISVFLAEESRMATTKKRKEVQIRKKSSEGGGESIDTNVRI